MSPRRADAGVGIGMGCGRGESIRLRGGAGEGGEAGGIPLIEQIQDFHFFCDRY